MFWLTLFLLSTLTFSLGEEIHDSYGAVYYHMEKPERQQYLKVSISFIAFYIF